VVPLTALQKKALQDYCRIGRLSQEWIEEKWPGYRRVLFKKENSVEDRTHMRTHLIHQMYLLHNKGLSRRRNRRFRRIAWDPDSEELDYIFQKTLESIYRPVNITSEVLEGWVWEYRHKKTREENTGSEEANEPEEECPEFELWTPGS
jgi:hypothetical protein